MDKKTFIIYKSWEGAIDKMTDEQVGQLFRKIYHPEMDITDPVVDILWGIVSQRLDEDSEKYAAKVERINKVNESKRNRDDIVTKSKRNRDDIVSDTDTVTDTVTDTDTVSPTEIKKETPTESRKKFSPPSAEEVAAYCRERQNKVNADTFVDFYTAKGWKVGNTPMKDWKACVRTWEKRDKQGNGDNRASPKTKFQNFEEQEYDFAVLERSLARN